MAQLARVESRKLLAFLGDAESLNGPDPFTCELLDRLGSTLASEFATFYTFDGFDRSLRDYVACSLEARYAVPLDEEWHRAPRYARVGAGDRALHAAQPRHARAHGHAGARVAAVPGESADAVPREPGRRQHDSHA